LGIEPPTREYEGDTAGAIEYVWSLNFQRRHLNSSQAAVADAKRQRLQDVYAPVRADAEERQKSQAERGKEGGRGKKKDKTLREQIPEGLEKDEKKKKADAKRTNSIRAKVAGTNRKYIDMADKLIKESPETVAQIERGETTLSKVKKQRQIAEAKARKEKQLAEALQNQSIPKVHQMSALDFAERFADQSIDLLLTDPPYSTDLDDVGSFAAEWLPVYLAKVRSEGRAYVCIGAYPAELSAYLSVPTPDHIKLCQVLCWTYQNTLGHNPRGRYKLNWQAILYYVGAEAPALDCPLTAEQWAVQDVKAPDGRHGDRYHTWQKPMELMERFIRHSSKPGQTVVDPFVCTGTTLLAAAKLGRIGVGCDISGENLDLAVRRGCQRV